MKRDAVHDGLIQINNAERARKKEVIINFASKLLIEIIKKMKERGYIKDYEVIEVSPQILKVKVILKGRINECKPIMPRLPVKVDNLQKYIERYCQQEILVY